MEAVELAITGSLKKYEAENSNVVEDLKSIWSGFQKVKEVYQKCRKDKLNKEHQLCQLEKQVIALNNHLGKESSELLRVKEKLEESNSKLDGNYEQIRKLDSEKTAAISKYNEIVNQQRKLQDEKTSLVEQLDSKSKELDRLNEEWELISNKLSDATKSKYEAQAKLDELLSSDVTREFKVKRLEQEKELLSSENARLSTQLNGKVEELSTLKRSKTSEVLDLQNVADSQKDQLKQLSTTCENLKEKSLQDEKRIESLLVKLKKARDDLTETESHMSRELSAKTKLVDLYKESSEDNKKKVDEMTSALLEIQKILKETDNDKLELDAKLELKEKEYQCTIRDLEEEIGKLNSELENANELLELSRRKVPSLSKEDVEGISPTAAAASSLIKKGMTLTQIYNEYVEVSNSLEAERDENLRLKQYMDQILQEIEEKAPALQRQKEEYEVAIKTIENLTSKFENAMIECDRYRTKCEDAVKEIEFTSRERDRIKMLCADLGQQVRVLVKEVEEARGGVVSTDYQVPPMLSSNTVSSSSQVISEHLVSFKSIEELQEQNQKLLAVVRDLSEEREKQEKSCSPEKMAELSHKLDSAFEQLTRMKEERSKQDEIIQTLVKQRDMYKVLYASEDRPEASTTFLRDSSEVDSGNVDIACELDKSKANFQRVTEEYETHRKEWKDKESALKDKNAKLEDEMLRFGKDNQLIKGKMEFLEEKNNSLASRNDALTRVNEAITLKSKGLESALSKLQKETILYKQELDSANEKLINLEVNLKSTITEKDLLKGTEKRLMQENKTLIEQQRSQNVLLTNLQTIQNNLERREFETRKALGQQVQQLQLEVKAIRRKLDTEELDKKKSIGGLNSQLEKVYIELENEKVLHLEAKTSNQKLLPQLEMAKSQYAELKELFEASEKRLKTYLEENEPVPAESLRLLKEQYEEKEKGISTKLKEADMKVSALSSQLQNANKHIDQYKQIALSCEEALEDSNQKYKALEKQSSSKSTDLENRVSDLSKKLEIAKAESNAAKVKSEKALQELHLEYGQLRKSYNALKKESEDAVHDIDLYKRQCSTAKEDAKLHCTTAIETQEKYERELVLHAKDVEELVKAKAKIVEYENSVSSCDMRRKEAESKLTAIEHTMSSMKDHLNEEVQKVREHSKELAEQNTLLHKEIEKLSAQIVDAKSQKIDLISKLTEDESKPKDQSTEDLYEVIRYIRREKEIAETKLEALQSENIRFRQRCGHFETELEETQSALDLERKRTLGLMLSREEHDELMSKVARVSELDVINKDLEREKDELFGENESLKSKLKDFQKEKSSLQSAMKLLDDDKGTWVAEKTALKNEIQRWTTRTQQLNEQNNKANRELDDLKNMQKSKAQNDSVITALKDENARLKGQKEAMTKEIHKLKRDAAETQDKANLLTNLADTIKTEKEQIQKQFSEEVEVLKKQLDEKTTEVSDKGKLILKLKTLARKYKSQYEELKVKGPMQGKDGESSESNQESSGVDAKHLEELDQENKKLQEKLEKFQSVWKENDELRKDIKRLEVSLKEAEESISSLNVKSKESVNKDSEVERKIADLNEQINKLSKENVLSKNSLLEKDAREERNKKLLRSAKEKINELSSQREKLTNDNEELRNSMREEETKHQVAETELNEKEALINALKAQHEAVVERLNKELDQLRSENERQLSHFREIEAEKRFAEERSNELAKMIAEKEETITKLRSQQASVKPIQDFPAAEPSISAPLTATVRPTASVVTSQSQKTMHSTRTASIRPLIPTLTPTAMVSPTVPPCHPSTHQGITPSANRIINSPAVVLAPETRASEVQQNLGRGQASIFIGQRAAVGVQSQESSSSGEIQATVSPIIAASNSDEHTEGTNEHGVASMEEGGSLDQMQTTQTTDSTIADVISEDYSPLLDIQNEPEDTGETEEMQPLGNLHSEQLVTTSVEYTQEHPSAHHDGNSGTKTSTIDTASYLKRRRSDGYANENEEESNSKEELDEKRQRIEEEDDAQKGAVGETEVISISDGDEDGDEFDDREENDEYDDAEDDDSEENVDEDEDVSEPDGEEDDEEELFDNEAHEDDYDGGEIEGEGEIEEADSDGAVDDDDDDDADDVGDDDDDDDDDDDGGEDGGEDIENDDDNVMEEIEVNQSAIEQQESGGERLSVTSTSPMTIREPNRDLQRRQPSPAAFMLTAQDVSGRGRVFRRRYQLPSFSLLPGQGGSGPFDEADDCTVPSTPTLYEPKRSDGFAEAVSSPQVRNPVFSFPAGTEGANRSQSVGLDSGVNDEGLRLDDTRIDLLAGDEPASVPSTPLGIVPSVTITNTEEEGEDVILSRQDVDLGQSGHSASSRVIRLGAEDSSQEQNVPQQIDLTGDDEDNVEKNVLSVGQQEDTDLFEDVGGQESSIVEGDMAIAQECHIEAIPTGQEHIVVHPGEQEVQLETLEKDDHAVTEKIEDTVTDQPHEITASIAHAATRPRRGRRPRIRRSVLQAKGQAADEKTEPADQ